MTPKTACLLRAGQPKGDAGVTKSGEFPGERLVGRIRPNGRERVKLGHVSTNKIELVMNIFMWKELWKFQFRFFYILFCWCFMVDSRVNWKCGSTYFRRIVPSFQWPRISLQDFHSGTCPSMLASLSIISVDSHWLFKKSKILWRLMMQRVSFSVEWGHGEASLQHFSVKIKFFHPNF